MMVSKEAALATRRVLYKGQDVTNDAGFRACMDAVLRFIQTVPFDTSIKREPRR